MGKFSLRPSGYHTWSTCAGSVKLIESLDITEEPKAYAAEGTVAHSICEDAARDWASPSDYVGEVREADGFKVVVSDDMAEACELMTDYLLQYPHPHELLIESHFPLDLGIRGLKGGRTDFIIHDAANKFIEVIDYKHGQGVAVDVDNNGQLLIYLLAYVLYLEFNAWDVSGYSFKITIVQPRTFHPRGKIRSQNWTYKDLMIWKDDTLIPAAELCNSDDPPFKASADACRFCDASPCAEQERFFQEMAVIDFEEFAETEEGEQLAPITPVHKLTVEQKMLIHKHSSLISKFLKDVEKEIFNEIEQGSKEYKDCYKIVNSIPKRVLTKNALDPIFSPIADYLTEDECYTKKPLGLGELEKAIKAKIREGGVKKGVPALAKKVMEQITEKPKGAPTLAPADDNREALPCKAERAAEDFKDV